MRKKNNCDVCKCEKSCKLFTIRSNNSKAFDTIKKILKLIDKNQLLICEEHYPSDAIKETLTKGKTEKNLDKDVKDSVPTLNMPRSDFGEPYPGEAMKIKLTNGEKDKDLDKDVKDRVPTLNMPNSDPTDQISVIEHVNEVSNTEKPTQHINGSIETENSAEVRMTHSNSYFTIRNSSFIMRFYDSYLLLLSGQFHQRIRNGHQWTYD